VLLTKEVADVCFNKNAGVLAPPNPVCVPEFVIVQPEGIVIVSPD
jgi:hypothetical protein